MPGLRWSILVLCLPLVARAEEEPSFQKQVAPLLRSRCLKCHAGKRPRGDLKLTTRFAILAGGVAGPAIKPGKAADSLLFQHVRDKKMPPRDPLTAVEVEVLRKWIDAGAKWDGPELKPAQLFASGRAGLDWWSLQPIRRPLIPVVKDRSRVGTPIDAFLLSALEAKKIGFSPEADRRTLIRRVTFDLIGLPPTPDEVDAFVNDPRPDAYERVVDRLLASPHHGERWARHWLDVVRFAESHGYEMNTLRPTAWSYRDYVIRAFNEDVPYRQFVREQLAGDVVAKDDVLASTATGFLVAGPHDMVGNATLEGKLQMRADDLFDMVANTSTTFLGLTVGCARCHDHKFDPIMQKEFYSLQAVFAGIEHAERDVSAAASPGLLAEAKRVREQLAELERKIDEQEPLANGKVSRRPLDSRRNVDRFAPVKAKSLRFVIAATFDGSEPCIDELELYGPGKKDNLARMSGVKTSASSVFPNNPLHRLEHLNDGIVGNSRSWISAERGKGWVRLDLPAEVILDRVIWGRDREGQFRDRLAKTYRIEVSSDGVNWTQVAGSGDRGGDGKGDSASQLARLLAEQSRLADRLKILTAPRKVYAGVFRSPDVTHLLNRGDVLQKREVVQPGTIAAVRPVMRFVAGAPESQRRLILADWITHTGNPLPARVMVNRIWHWHFGQGIVRTPSDFGYNGDRPSHPALLDWLASEFQASGGQFKHLHRLIVLSSAYRQASRRDDRAAVDMANRLLWRGPSRRLEAEAIRDAMLRVSGVLDTRMGGPGYHLWDYSGYVIVFKPKEKLGPETFRRMVYQFKPRLQQDGAFGAFDCPDATATTPKRNTSTTPLQALNLLNDPFVLDQADRFAQRVRKEAGTGVETQVKQAFRVALGRLPTIVEAQGGEKLVRDHGLALLCRVLFNTNEFVFVH
jgi:hypothetical protein